MTRFDDLSVCPYCGQFTAGLWRVGFGGMYFVGLHLGFNEREMRQDLRRAQQK
jgi:hypothetical protein